jgi:predicted membrane channel-forming protein YqfA (hemolysin III family)
MTGMAAVVCFFCSFIYHTFGCYSSRAFDVLLHIDYAGIIMLEMSMTISSEYFGYDSLFTS